MMEQTTTTHEAPATTTSVGLRYGLITGFISVIYSLILFVTEMNNNSALSYLSILILAGGIFFAYKHFKGMNGGFMSYGQGLGIGTVLSAVAGLLGGIFTFIYVKFVDTAFLQKVQDLQIAKMEEQGLSEAQIEKATEMAATFSGPGMMLVMGILGTLVIGFLVSLVMAAIMKRSQPEFE
ncbi:DUF4199 domain-containing protein [Rufibacter sp. DG15C]|uniref:DUF4199 domain-containing protein n=1 Tax=Rufibacter sp. DG15C TaxID=1379909 RepID=UPI0008373BAF|nr:DUF4199 domain-containing protein [Rufibacter sp. DG15C]